MKARPKLLKGVEDDLIDALISDWNAEKPKLDVAPMAVVGRLIFLGRQLEQRAGERLKDFDLKYTEFDVLATLRRSGDPYELTPTELMKSVLITSGAMTALLDRLSSRKLIMRGQNRKDGRIKTARLTESGKKLIDTTVEVRFAEAREAVQCYSKQDQKLLSDCLRSMSVWLERLDEGDAA